MKGINSLVYERRKRVLQAITVINEYALQFRAIYTLRPDESKNINIIAVQVQFKNIISAGYNADLLEG